MKPTFKFTGKEISDELYSIILKLENGEVVDLKEIEQTDEFILGNNMCARGIETIYIKGRELLQENIVNIINNRGSVQTDEQGKITFDGPVNTNKRLDIVVGLPASGKSSAVANTISEELGSVLLDNDEIKKYIPDYYGGWGEGLVHMESKKINKKVMCDAINAGKNIIFPKIGGYANEIIDYIDLAKSKGYTVNIHYVALHRNKALLRLLNRFINTGRFIPPSTIYLDDNEKDGNKIEKVFKQIISSKKVDGFSIWNNDVPKNERPILLKSFGLYDKFIIEARRPTDKIKENTIISLEDEINKFYSDYKKEISSTQLQINKPNVR